ncbi:MAG TPA: hypothetical protein VH325_04535 [Bryobacteraceae bacterium]|jgi:hypothetical protein|nr:hypothetical protein [Bryobacteraceae bacterium]
MFAWLVCKRAVPVRDPKVAMPFAIVTVAAQYMPDLMSGLAENVLRISRRSDSPTKLIVECRAAALIIGALAMIGCLALKRAYRAGILTREDVEFARDSIIQTAIDGFVKDHHRVEKFRIMQSMGFLPGNISLQEYELSLVRPVLNGFGQVLKQGGSADRFWITELGDMLDAANVPQAFRAAVLEFFWLDFQPMLLSAKSDMVAALR